LDALERTPIRRFIPLNPRDGAELAFLAVALARAVVMGADSVGAARACGICAGPIEFLERFGIQLQIGGTEQLMELIEICSTGNWSGNARLRQQPGDGYLG
jgi:hypothetical protein